MVDAEKTAPLNVFLTGGSTPLGLAVMRRLAANGHKVSGITSSNDGAILIRAAGGLPVFSDPLVSSEIKAMLAMTKAEVVIHLANATGLPYRSTLDAQHVRQSTLALVNAVEGAKVRYLVAVSHAFLYGASADDHSEHGGHAHGHAPTLITEDSPLPDPGEDPLLRAVYDADETIQDANLPACVLRTGYLYGAVMPETISLAETLRAARPIALGSPNNHANWVQMDDAAEAICAAAERSPIDTTYNIVDDAPTSPVQFAEDFARAMGVNLPGRLPNFLGRALGSKASTTLLALSSAASNARAKAELGWTLKYPTHEKGIDQALFMWRSEMLISR